MFRARYLSLLLLPATLALPLSAQTIENWSAAAAWTPARALSDSKSESASKLAVPTAPLPFVGITPCRIADTRGNGFAGAYGPPSLAEGDSRDFPLAGQCGIPAFAEAVSLNVTVTNTLGPGFILIHPQGGAQPGVSTLNYDTGDTVANAAVVALGAAGGITLVAGVSGTDVILDVNGYYGGGVITGVAAGAGLEGGGTSGSVSLSLLTSCGAQQVLKWNGADWACSSDTGHDHFGQSWSGTASTGLFVTNSGFRALRGLVTAVSGINFGVQGETSSTSGKGVYGLATAISGDLAYGVHGESRSSRGKGVFGFATASSGFNHGVHGRSDSSQGSGVVGEATAASGLTRGVLGTSDSNGGFGGYFQNASGGIALYASGGASGARIIDTNSGAYLSNTGVWTDNSDRDTKENLEPVDRRELLARLAGLPITSWNYKVDDPSVRHVGPMAQDFAAAFELGNDTRAIASLDTAGIALAAIQGLYEILEGKDDEIRDLRGQITRLREQVEGLASRNEELSARRPEGPAAKAN